MADDKHYTEEGVGFVDATAPNAVEEARKRHHLATADPEPERDGTMTGAAHERKYGLKREQATAEYWRGVGVHPYENRALKPGDEGYVADNETVETTEKRSAAETADAPRAKRSA